MFLSYAVWSETRRLFLERDMPPRFPASAWPIGSPCQPLPGFDVFVIDAPLGFNLPA